MCIVGIFMMPDDVIPSRFKDIYSLIPKNQSEKKRENSFDLLGCGNECVYVYLMDMLGRQPSFCLRQANTFLHCLLRNNNNKWDLSNNNNRGKTTNKLTVTKKFSNKYFLTRLGRNAVGVTSTSSTKNELGLVGWSKGRQKVTTTTKNVHIFL